MKKLILISIALLLIGSLLIAQKVDDKRSYVPAHAKDWKNPNLKARPEPMGPMLECMDEMNLTAAQKTKFEELRTAFSKTENTLKAEIENLKIDLKTAMKNENYKQAKELNKQIATKKTTLADARIDLMAARMKELTKEQKEIMKNKMPMMGMHKQGMMGNCMGQGMMMHKRNMSPGESCGQMQRKFDNCLGCDDQEKGEGPNRKSIMENPK